MRKKSGDAPGQADHDLDIAPMTGRSMRKGQMGKCYEDVMAGSNVVRIAPELAREFPNEKTVNDALRDLLRLREALKNITGGARRKTA